MTLALAPWFEFLQSHFLDFGKKVYNQKLSQYYVLPNNLVDVTAYYLGGKTNSKGIFECSFLIEEPGVPKDEWPQVKFTGDRFQAAFSGYKQYQKVNLDLAKRTARRKK